MFTNYRGMCTKELRTSYISDFASLKPRELPTFDSKKDAVTKYEPYEDSMSADLMREFNDVKMHHCTPSEERRLCIIKSAQVAKAMSEGSNEATAILD